MSAAKVPLPPGRRRRRRVRRTLEGLLVAAALYLAVTTLSEVGWRRLETQVLGARRLPLLLLLPLLPGRWLFWTARWRSALRHLQLGTSWWRTLGALLAATAVNHLTPTFRVVGGLLRARYLSSAPDRSFPSVYGSVLFDQILNQTVMGVMSAVAFVLVSWSLGHHGQTLAAVVVVATIVLLVPLLWRRAERQGWLPTAGAQPPSDGATGGRGAWRRSGAEVVTTLRTLFAARGLVLRGVAWSLLYALTNVAAAWVAFTALGTPPPLVQVYAAVSLGVTVGALSGTPGGGLTTEAAMVACYTLLGVERDLALAATLLYRGAHYLAVIALGLPALGVLEWRHRRSGNLTNLS